MKKLLGRQKSCGVSSKHSTTQSSFLIIYSNIWPPKIRFTFDISNPNGIYLEPKFGIWLFTGTTLDEKFFSWLFGAESCGWERGLGMCLLCQIFKRIQFREFSDRSAAVRRSQDRKLCTCWASHIQASPLPFTLSVICQQREIISSNSSRRKQFSKCLQQNWFTKIRGAEHKRHLN